MCCSYFEFLEPVDHWCFMKNNTRIISHANSMFCGVETVRGRLLNVYRNSGRSVTSNWKLYSVFSQMANKMGCGIKNTS